MHLPEGPVAPDSLHANRAALIRAS